MYSNIKLYLLIILLCTSCVGKEINQLEVLFEEVYFETRENLTIAPRNRMIGKIISQSKDTLYFYSRCSSCLEKGETHSFVYTVNNKDTIELGSYYASKLVIPPLDTVEYQVSFMLLQHATNKALQRPDSAFLFKYDSIYLANIAKSEMSYTPSTIDYTSKINIPNVIFKRAENFKVHFQDYKKYKFNNQH